MLSGITLFVQVWMETNVGFNTLDGWKILTVVSINVFTITKIKVLCSITDGGHVVGILELLPADKRNATNEKLMP